MSALVLLDVDGTLIDHQYKLTVPKDEFVRALAEMQDSGLVLGLNSDSALPTVRAWAQEWGIRGPLLSEQSVICLPDEDYRQIPMHEDCADFPDIRDAFVGDLLRRNSRGRYLITCGDVNTVVDSMPCYGHENDSARGLVAVNTLRQYSLSFFVRARDGIAWAPRESEELNTPMMAEAVELLNRVGESHPDLWRHVEMDINMRYGICICHRAGVRKSTPVKYLLEMRDYDRVYMVGDGIADRIDDERVVQCAVANAHPTYKALCTLIADTECTSGSLELLRRICASE